MIVRTAWKNVWRNKIRSMVVITSVTIGIFGGAFAIAVMNGAIQQRVDAALNDEISYIQINRPGFNDNNDIQLTLKNTDEMNKKILSIPGVESTSFRSLVSAMASTATKSRGIQLIGIDPEYDKEVFELYDKVIPGTGGFLQENGKKNLAYIGEDLAKELNIIRYIIETSTIDSLREMGVPREVLMKIEPFTGTRFTNQKSFSEAMQGVMTKKETKKYGRIISDEAWSFRSRSKLTLTFLDKDNTLTGGMFRIAGIYDIKNNMFESNRVFLLNSDIHKLTGMNSNDYQKMIIRINNTDNTEEITEKVQALYPNLEVRSWKEIQPDLAMSTEMIEQFYFIFMLIILAALAFGIVNTMLMVVLERTKELGMLTAIGMNKKRVFKMIMTESVFLSIIGGITGMFISWGIIMLTAKNGINFSQYKEGFEAMGYSSHVYPLINPSFFIVVTILIIITGILSSIYPALKALKLDPAEALRTE